MSTTTEELKKLYKKLGGSENTTRAASTPAEVLNGINELDFGFDTDGDLKLAGENSDIILTDDENTWDGTNKSLKDALTAASLDHIEFNPDEPATEDLEKLKGNGVVYGIPKFTISKEAEGNPITFADGADSPLVECEVEFEAQQDLHGYDKPWVGGAGKNKLPNTYTSTSNNGITYTVQSDGSVIATNTATANSTIDLMMNETLHAGTYVLNGVETQGTSGTYRLRYRINGSDYTNCYYGGEVSFTVNGTDTVRIQIMVPNGFSCPTGGLLFKPMIRLSTETDPTFAPYSNICPVSGYSEVGIEGCGKNLLNPNKLTQDSSANIVWGYYNDGIFLKGGKTYTLSLSEIVGSQAFYEMDHTTRVAYTGGTGDTQKLTYTPDSDKYVCFKCYKSTGVSVSDVSDNWMLELGSTATAYEPYTPNSYTISLGSTRYGGELDVVRGVLRVTHGIVNLNTSTMNNNSSYPGWTNQTWLDNYAHESESGRAKDNVLLNIGEYIAYNAIGNNSIVFLPQDSYGGLTQEEWIAKAQDVQIAYELATPVEVQLTPTEIKSLLGNNTIFTDGKTLSIEYITKGASAVIKLIKALMPKANPAGDATDTLNKLEVDGTVYSLPSGGGGGIPSLANVTNTIS